MVISMSTETMISASSLENSNVLYNLSNIQGDCKMFFPEAEDIYLILPELDNQVTTKGIETYMDCTQKLLLPGEAQWYIFLS